MTRDRPADGKLAHLDGLNLSRAWMLEGVVSALPEDDAAAAVHRDKGLAAVTGEHYEGGHWSRDVRDLPRQQPRAHPPA